ncbi:MAG: hypothetical protein HOV79_07600 [Hamadaea sp.]|nr:hypothetical protein [Hamadaea sp.]
MADADGTTIVPDSATPDAHPSPALEALSALVAAGLRADPERVYDLGFDPATGRFRPTEAQTAVRVERLRGVRLHRAPPWSAADWVDQAGHTYDAVGNFPAKYFDQQWGQFRYQITRHARIKAEFVPVDVSQFSPEQIAEVRRFIADTLGPSVFLVGH